MEQSKIREGCLTPFSDEWLRPNGEEVREILRRTGLSGAQAAKLVGIADGRQVRRWIGEDAPIPYAAWAIFCDFAGIARIWQKGMTANDV
ncbi:hypothetical protein [Pandoraea apista]|uniref:hypothetical protein n=1 Tax=Pandoraea apista TaxID=93218 RepID=UPI000657DCBE|nr:hypothetical protein [Pandoraea apista]ALS68400.1 transcriptional regulator [Pandoraea apista]CFB60421.1 hypothetical protein LMG16407_00460 [Pandoraea apista]